MLPTTRKITVPQPVGLVCRIPVQGKVVIVEKPAPIVPLFPKKKAKVVKAPRKRVYLFKSECVNGHKLEAGNLYYPNGRRKRECRQCSIDRALRAYYKRKGIKQ